MICILYDMVVNVTWGFIVCGV